MIKKIWAKYVVLPLTDIHEWLRERMPGLKTKLITAVGAIGSAAGLVQEYVSGIPLNQLLGVSEALMISTILFTLAFVARTLTK